MERHLITEQELMSQLRQQGIEFLAEVKKAYIESDGSISIITYDAKTRPVAEESKVRS